MNNRYSLAILAQRAISILMGKFTLLIMLSAVSFASAFSQLTPGMIIQQAQAPGRAILDPDQDGYVSSKTNGVQLGFTNPPNNDITQSEIPYVAIVKPDPRRDLLRGASGGSTEIVGVDGAGNNAIMGYNDGTNFLVRFRMDATSSSTSTYCLLIDTDGKFGFTGDNADPNAVTGNAGFEIEVTLTNNFHVRVWNVDGTTSGTLVYSGAVATHHQKSVALTTSGGNPDYFYDFYVPFTALTGINFADSRTKPSPIAISTPLRMTAVTTMNGAPAIGNTSISDVGGITTGSNIDQIYTDVITAQTPTPPGEEVLERSLCPTVNAVSTADNAITGTTTEAVGTLIRVKIYASNGTTLLGTATTTTSSSSWSVNVSGFSPAVTLTAGQIVRATATAPEKGESADNCSEKVVKSAVCAATAPTSFTFTNSGKNFNITFSMTSTQNSVVINVYRLDGVLWKSQTFTDGPFNSGSTYTRTVISSGGNPEASGNKYPNGTYYVRMQYGGCESLALTACLGTATNTNIPTVTSPLTVGTTTVSGTGGVNGSYIVVYSDTVRIGGAAVTGTSWSVSVPALTSCESITARQGIVQNASDLSNCLSASSNAVVVSRVAAAPNIYPLNCVTGPYDVSGTSGEVNGTQIRLFTWNGSVTTGTVATVSVQNGFWEVSGLSATTYPSGTQFVARALTQGCITESANSNVITVTTRPLISGYSISINNPVEGAATITGTISGGTYPVILRAYVDEIFSGKADTINSAGNWTVTQLAATDLYLGASIRVSLTTGAGCESTLSTVFATVQCTPPSIPTYSGGNYSYCVDGVGEISISNTETGVIYQLVNSSGTAQGPSFVGNGGSVTLSTFILSSNLTNVYVYAYKLLNPSCGQISSTAINFNIQNPAPSVSFTSTSLSVQAGTASVNLSYTAKSSSPSADKYTILWSVAAKQQGFEDVVIEQSLASAPSNIAITVPISPAPAPGTYSGTISIYSDGGGCIRNYGFSVSVYGATSAPILMSNPVGATICSGNTATMSVTATGSGTLAYQWQESGFFAGPYSNISGANTASYTTVALSADKYYRCIVSNAYGSTFSDVAIIRVNSAPGNAGSITGATTINLAGFQLYSITAVEGATSYVWSYSGTGANIIGSGTSVYVSFSSNATSGDISVKGVNSCGVDGGTSTLGISIMFNGAVISNKNITPRVLR